MRKSIFNQLSVRYSNHKLREILLAAEGLKVTRTLVAEKDVAEFVQEMTAIGLYAVLYDRKYVCQADAGKGGWISRHGFELALEANPDGFLMVYLADNPNAALRAMEAEHAHADQDFGSLLGIPACCSTFYTASIEAAEQEQNDFILPVLENTGSDWPYLYETNIAVQYFDDGLLSFYPCSFKCSAAANFTMDIHRILAQHNRSWADGLLKAQHDAILYTEYEGIYRFPGARYESGFLYYDPSRIESTLNGVLWNLLLQGDRWRLVDSHQVVLLHGSIVLGEFRSRLAGMLIFD